jgi:hypothetical protein
MSAPQKDAIRQELAWMLDWSLKNTVLPDGGFRFDPTFSSSLAGAYYFGVSFYDTIGYWNQDHKFWSNEPISQRATEMCCRIKGRLESLGLNGWASLAAHRKLMRNCAVCSLPRSAQN